MTFQFLGTCLLYIIPGLPLHILVAAHLCGLPENIGVEPQLYFDFLCYFVLILYPFVCLVSQSELREKLKWQRLFTLRGPQQTATVGPQ